MSTLQKDILFGDNPTGNKLREKCNPVVGALCKKLKQPNMVDDMRQEYYAYLLSPKVKDNTDIPLIISSVERHITETLCSRAYARMYRLPETDTYPRPSPEPQIMKNIEIVSLRERLPEMLSEVEVRVIECVFFEGMTDAKAADAVGYSRQHTNRIKHRALAKIRKKLDV